MYNSDVLVDVCHGIKFSKPTSAIDVILFVWCVYVCVRVCMCMYNACKHVYVLCSTVSMCVHTHALPIYVFLYANTQACMCNMCKASYSEEHVEDCGGVLLRLNQYRVQSKNVLVVIESYNPYKITSL